MKTEVIMKRELFGHEISQKSQSEFFSATDLTKAGNEWRRKNGLPDFNLSAFLNTKSSLEFISELNSKFGQSIIKGGKKGTHTWVHPLLFVDIALNIDIKLKIEVYQWIYDELLKYRNDSGDSYKKMCTSLFNNCTNKSNFHRSITKTAELIKSACNVEKWETASEDKLKLRDKIHENISLLCDVLRDNNQAIRIGIIKAIEQK